MITWLPFPAAFLNKIALFSFLALWQNTLTKSPSILIYISSSQPVIEESQELKTDTWKDCLLFYTAWPQPRELTAGRVQQAPWKNTACWLTHSAYSLILSYRTQEHPPRNAGRALLHQIISKTTPHRHAHWLNGIFPHQGFPLASRLGPIDNHC